jgi:LysM repeat protein
MASSVRGYDRRRMADRNLARLLAPLALIVAFVAVVAVVAVSGQDGSPDPSPLPRRTVATQQSQTTTSQRPRPRVYVVQPGDSLSVIADETGRTIEEIQQLNPDVDPQALQTGQRLKLTP